MKDSQISYFKYKKTPGHKTLTIFKILNTFGTNKFKDYIEQGRFFYQQKNFESYNLLKGKLIAVTFSGVFSPTRTLSNLISYTGFIILDVDKSGDSLKLHKEMLMKDEFVHAVWISPSGDGLKFLIKTSNDSGFHKLVYYSAVAYFKQKYDLNVDTSGSDIPRLCYVSYDPEIYLNTNANIYNEMISIDSNDVLDLKKSKKLRLTLEKEDVHFDKRNFKNSNFDKERLKRIYQYLSKRSLSITSNHNDWVRVAFAISNSFNYDFGYNWFIKLAQLDGQYYDEYECIKLISRCYNTGISHSTFGTIQYLAEKQGWELR